MIDVAYSASSSAFSPQAKIIDFLFLEPVEEGKLWDVLPAYRRHLRAKGERLSDLLDALLHLDEELVLGAPLPLLSLQVFLGLYMSLSKEVITPCTPSGSK
ncbi:hypothetical protein HAX54_029676 [Datura stramonium]|uniref:Uncharacterized protein n=1 Tax=Datura stramonium TaxID=4076 RepID=A0ABS8V7A6_DATST|nr:hypothetical protein [Datura stramonium]